MNCSKRERGETWCKYMLNSENELYQKGDGVAYCSKGFICVVWAETVERSGVTYNHNESYQRKLGEFDYDLVKKCEKENPELYHEYEEAMLDCQQAIDNGHDTEYQRHLQRLEKLYERIK